MPKKPTSPFGYIAFGADGSVKKCIQTLPDIKEFQEKEVSQKFAKELECMTGQKYAPKSLPENDQDFLLNDSILVQATEIVYRDYLCPVKLEDYINGRHSFTQFVSFGPEDMRGVDNKAKDDVLLKRITNKIGHYSKPEKPLWLLVWTVCFDYNLFWNENGNTQIAPALYIALEYLFKNGCHPFDAIWFYNLSFAPCQIFPPVNYGLDHLHP
jgi:hypothetical protein